MLESLKEAKEINTLINKSLLKTKKTRKAAKAGEIKGKMPAAGGSKAKNKVKSSKKKGGGSKAKAKNDSSVPRTRRTPTRRKMMINHVSQ